MKISEMTNDQATDAMIRLASAFSVLFEDEETEKLISEMDGMELRDAIKSIIPRLVTFGLSKHKNELYEIVGALNSVPVSEVGEMNFFDTIASIQNSYDEVLKNFFISSGIARKNKESE